MSRFLLVSMYELKQFLQIVLWIAIPGTVIAFLVTTFFHYKRKKKGNGEAEPAYMEGVGFHTVVATETGNEPAPDWLVSGTNPDNQPLIKKYEQEVRRYRENYAILEQDFRELEGKYADLMNKAYSNEKQNGDDTDRLQQELSGYKLKVSQLQQALEEAQNSAKSAQGTINHSMQESFIESQQQIRQLQDTIQQLQEKSRLHHEQREKSAAEITRLENLLKNMEHSAKSAQTESEELQRYYAKQVDELGQQYKTEKTDLGSQVHLLHAQIQQLKDENIALQQKIQANGDQKYGNYEQQIKELQLLLSKAEEEKAALKSKITDQQYLQDLLQEKKLQIDFLQNQLEQRIRSFREVEKEAADKAAQVQLTQSQKENFEREIHALREELQQQREEVNAWQQAVERSREESRQYQDNLRSKTGHIENLERNLHEVQQQQAVLQLVLDDKQNMITGLQESLHREQQKTKDLENKLITNNQLLSKIYGDLSKSLSNPPASPQQNGTKLNGGTNGSNGHAVNGNGFNLAGQQHS